MIRRGRYAFAQAAGRLDGALEARGAACLDEHALLPGPLALLFDPPVGVVADAAGLADDQVGGGQRAVDAVQAFFQSAIVMQEPAAAAFDNLSVGIDGAGAAADTEDAFAAKIRRHARMGGFGMVGVRLQLRFQLGVTATFPLQGFLELAAARRERDIHGFGIGRAAGQRLPVFHVGQAVLQLFELAIQRREARILAGGVGL